MSITWEENLKVLTDFAVVAEEYCSFIEGLHKGRPGNLYASLEALLVRLLSQIQPVAKETNDRDYPELNAVGLNQEQSAEISRLVAGVVAADMLALMEWHKSLGDPADPTDYIREFNQTRSQMLFDDLADLYGDLHRGLVLWKLGKPEARIEAAWEWRFGFESHWGRHLHRAMTSVHELRYCLHLD